MLYQSMTCLVVVFTKQSALLQILATHAVSRPWHRIKALLGQCLTAVNTLAITRCFDPLEGFVDQVQQLAIVVRHRHQQLFCIRVSSHVGRILRGLGVAFTTIKLRRLDLPNQTFATAQQFISENFCAPFIHYCFNPPNPT
jgi:hypothetical protein